MTGKIKHNYWLAYQFTPDYALKFSVRDTSESEVLSSAKLFISAYIDSLVSTPGVRYSKTRLRVLRFNDWAKYNAVDISFNPFIPNKHE